MRSVLDNKRGFTLHLKEYFRSKNPGDTCGLTCLVGNLLLHGFHIHPSCAQQQELELYFHDDLEKY